jgi:hypothetical protein
MSYTSNFNLNQRVSYLESEISKIAPIPVGGYNLANVLTIGDNAGANDIDLNGNELQNVSEISFDSATPIISMVDSSLPTRFINLNASVPNITITDGINTNIITPLGSGGTTANTQNVEITDVNNNQTYYPILSGSSTGFNPCRVNSTGLTYNAQTEVLSLGSLPECSDVPSSNSQLVNKLYVDGLLPPPLSAVLSAGNSAGANDIDLNNQDILQVNNIDLTTINGSAYPPSVPADTLSDVLTAGNTANNSIILTDGVNTTTIDETSITSTTFNGALNGNASTATDATNTAITASSTNASFYPTFVSATTGNLPQLVDTDLTYNPSTNVMSFTALPECSAIPINDNQLVNKSFVYNTTLEDFDADTNTAAFAGNKIVFGESGSGSYIYYLGDFSSDVIGGTIGRRGILQLNSGGSGGNETMLLPDRIYSLANITKLTFGFIPLGNENFATEGRVPPANIAQALGLSGAVQQTGTATSQSILWRLLSLSGTVPTWEFVINNVVQYTSTLGELTGKWCRVSFDISFDGVNYSVQSTLTNLTDGTTETTAVYTLTTGFVFNLNSIAPYMLSGTNNNTNKYLGIDYCELQQNLYNIGGGNTITFR